MAHSRRAEEPAERLAGCGAGAPLEGVDQSTATDVQAVW